MIPYAVTDLEQFIPTAICVVDAVPFSAQFDPPKIVILIVVFVGQIRVRFIAICPCRG